MCDQVKEDSEVLSEGYYIDDTLKKLFHMTYFGYPENLEEYKKAIEIEKTSMHDAFTIEALKAHIFDPEYTKLITKARLRNCAMLQIVDLMSISRPRNSKERKGRISYSALGINQMGAVYEALLSYRGFIAEEDLYEVKRAGDKFNELDVGYFVKEDELENYDEKTERVRYESGEKKGQLRMYKKGTFIYRLAGREREKSASYYTPEVLTKCLVKYALKELLKDKTADEILHLTVCEPAMGSAAFLNEAINQLAEAYLTKKQEELGETISYDKRFKELQKVKMFIADRNVYGCDLNPVAVELAEVSLWLNTIYKGAYVPWFGTQLVNGNSLIGARRQVYSQSALEAGKWYDKTPRRIMPGEERTKKGQHEHTKEIYHFLLGDPGMANYSDKVIKGLEPEKIKMLKAWNKEFTSKFEEDELKTVLRLSESIDKLWKLTADERKRIEKETYEPLSVYGHDELGEGSHKSIREKDEIYKRLFKSEKAQNAGPYARLKAAMDYWCALWFWPIDKADLLPSRQEFFFDMSLILEGNIRAVNVNSSGQMVFQFEEDGSGLKYVTEGDRLALEFKAQYADLGEVCLDNLRERSERLAIANEIAIEQRFQHWELEFADVFEERGGFDLVIGNPPWNKLTWNERNVLGEYYPFIEIKNWSSSDVDRERNSWLEDNDIRGIYYKEYVSLTGLQTFISAIQNYEILKGVQADLYKCFIPKAFYIVSPRGVASYVHPEGIYDDPKGEAIRTEMYKRLSYHFQFINQRKLFDIGNTRKYSLNVYADNNGCVSFDSISNLFETFTIDESYQGDDLEEVEGIKNKLNEWNTKGHSQRIIHICEDDLSLFNSVFGDGTGNPNGAKLPAIHTQGLLDILKKQRDGIQRSIKELNKMIKALEDKPQDSSYDKQIKDLKEERAAWTSVVAKINEKNVFNFLSDAGLLPNYAFPEAGIVLKAVLTRVEKDENDREKNKYESTTYEYNRSASSAISEFAPLNSFYAGGHKLTIDQVDINTAKVEPWRLCPNCSHASIEDSSTPAHVCPKCGNPGWADAGQVRSMFKVQMVYSNMKEEESQIGDDSEDRASMFYDKELLVDVDEDKDVIQAFEMDNKEFKWGYEFLQKATMREINFGEQSITGDKLLVAGHEGVRKGFTICKYCGKIQVQGEKSKHSRFCKMVKDNTIVTDPFEECLFLYREFETEALRLLIPATTMDATNVRVESFVAAFMLGMKKKFGNVDHLRATVSEVPVPEADYRKQYLVIYDSVPGGTGYLKQLMNEENGIIDVFEGALETMEHCSCNDDPQKDGCYKCLYAYRQSQHIGEISRDSAITLLKTILSGKVNAQ